jgi:riboflavin kinase/FMN adenylyltransferase
VERARTSGLHSVLLTFEPHPLEIVRPARAPLLLTDREEKLEALATTGVEYVAVLPFTPALQAMSAADYVRHALRGRLRMRELLVGTDHGFGKGREGNVATLRALAEAEGFRVEVVTRVSAPDGSRLSSSVARDAVARGDLDAAGAVLGRPYAVLGRVGHGEQRGRALGFRTLNLEPPSPRKLLPPEGVYAVRAFTPAGTYGGMMNLGPRPTFGDARVGLEVHLFDADGDWYGAPVRVEFVRRLRDTRRFENAEALVAQLRRDETDARAALAAAKAVGAAHGGP